METQIILKYDMWTLLKYAAVAYSCKTDMPNRCSVICVSVHLSVHLLDIAKSCAKAAEPISLPFEHMN